MKKFILLILFIYFPIISSAATEPTVPLDHAHINFKDQASLQRGAKLYINYCLGCHSLRYLRYNVMARDIGITLPSGKVDTNLVENNLIFSGAKISDTILTAMPELAAQNWFGVAPPDLSLIVKVRGADWLYTYLRGFYVDHSRPFGVNNLVFPDTAMPNVLARLQGVQIPIYKDKTDIINGKTKIVKVIAHLALEQQGKMSSQQFDSAVNDIVNFLAYTAAPETVKRHWIGYWVVGFLILFTIVAYLLKREYWKDIK